MITNERQYRITNSQLRELKAALEAFDLSDATTHVGSATIARAEQAALESQVEDLIEQVAEYEALKSGRVAVLRAPSLEELPSILIKARIARGYSQRQLAEKLGVKEQQIQRYEAEGYVSASLSRLVDIATVLDLEISEAAKL